MSSINKPSDELKWLSWGHMWFSTFLACSEGHVCVMLADMETREELPRIEKFPGPGRACRCSRGRCSLPTPWCPPAWVELVLGSCPSLVVFWQELQPPIKQTLKLDREGSVSCRAQKHPLLIPTRPLKYIPKAPWSGLVAYNCTKFSANPPPLLSQSKW